MEVRLGRRALIRLVGRSVQAIGISVIAGALAGLSVVEYGQASALLAVIGTAVAPSPSPSPSPEPTAAPRLDRGGPLEFSLNGTLAVGESNVAATRTDALGNPTAQSSSTASSAVGLYAELRRRTGSSTADVRLPLGFSQGGTQVGALLVGFSTPHYALQYGPQGANVFGQIPLGGTIRGFALVLPLSSGDVAFYEGPNFGVDQETVHVQGFRARRLIGRDLFELAFARNASSPLTGSATTLVAGLATSRGRAAFVGELASQERHTPTGDVHGVAMQWRADVGTPNSGWTFAFRHMPDRFLAYGAGELNRDDYRELAYRAAGKRGNLSADLTFENAGSADNLLQSRRSSLGYGGQLGNANYQLTFQEQRLGGTQPVQWSGSGTAQLGVPFAQGFALFGVQLGRTTTYGSDATGLSAFSAQVQRQFGPLALQFTTQSQQQTNPELGASHLQTNSFGAQRQFGRTGFGFQYTRSHTLSAFADAIQRTPQIAISRQISPALSLQMTLGRQSNDDLRDPRNNGTSRIFNVLVNAPFAFGNGVVQGRVDPRLPAIIAGRVVSDLGDNFALAGLATGGVANAVVVLDGTEVQRTDLDGNFQFSFVHPGQHQLRVETSSLPRGLTVDQPIVTLNVDGGQTGQVYFRVGDFGGVAGHVFGRDSNGGTIPLENVLLRVDGAAYSQTDRDGAYGFGRLRPGQHTIAIVLNSVPAFASFDPSAATQKIDVRDGQIAPLDFVGAPLGSIEGFVRYDKALKGYDGGGVQNAYVVAEPGEHAAITDADGSFVIDDLPPGTYAVSVDPETVDDAVAPEGDPLSVTLIGNDHYRGAEFVVGEKQKSVVFSFLGSGASAASVRLDDGRLPPGGTTAIAYTAPPSVKDAKATFFGKTFALTYDEKRSVWRGTAEVPAGTKAGSYEIAVSATGISTVATASLTVDPHMPIVIVQVTPPNVAPGQYAAVRARFLVDVRAGDTIAWSDGSTTVLGKPVAGRVFTFTLRVSLRPLYGTLLTRHARLPIRLL